MCARMLLLAGVLLAGMQRLPAEDSEAKAEVEALRSRAERLEKAGKFREAIPLREQLLEKVKQVYGPRHTVTAARMNDLANLYQDSGQYARALPLYRSSLEILEERLGKDHPSVAGSLNNLASVHYALGHLARAEPLYRRCLEVLEARLGKDHLDVATALNNLAVLHQEMAQHARAEPLLKRSLAIREKKLGEDHPHVALSLNNLAELYREMGRYARAEPLYRRSLAIRESRLSKDHPEVAQSLGNMALLYQAMGQHARAEALFKRSLAIDEARLGKDHPNVANALNNLAGLYQVMGRYAQAQPLFQRSLDIREARLGKDHPLVAATLNNLAGLYGQTDRPGEAARLFDRARRGARHHLASVLPALSEADKAAFFQSTPARKDLEMALSLGLANRSAAVLSARSAGWLLNGKGIDQESLASSLLLVRQSKDPALGKLATRLLSVRQRLARLTLFVPSAAQAKQRLAALEELTRQEQELGKQLRQAGSTAALPPWVDLADLRRALPADAAFIDLAHFPRFDFQARPGQKKWQDAHYAAWVTTKAGPVRLIDLGNAEKIDLAIKQFRETMQTAAQRIKSDGEEKAEQALREHLDVLSKLVLQPLLPHVGASKRWLIGPDGNLWLLPFEALTLKNGHYAIEKHHISYLTSGRDLLGAAKAKVKVGAPLVLADPDFDLDPAQARAEARRLLGAPQPMFGDEESTRSGSGGLRLGSIKRLAGTAAEARAIAPSLKGLTGAVPQVFTRAQALESVFKAARSPRVVVLCTHGFFLPDQEVPRDDKAGAVKKWENPLLRCGLLLAGCNNAAKASDGDDGVLTGLEVVGTDLRGCELVVLSACETGLGEVQSGEGVAGLRQAFQLAGAQSVVSTLWQVPDKQSARLMTFFFANLSGGKMSKAEALRAAKLKLIADRRDDFAAAHPFFWAAFTLTGQP
jgi:CHAT domain-containing protein/Tfp pilus assembly protein PilF